VLNEKKKTHKISYTPRLTAFRSVANEVVEASV